MYSTVKEIIPSQYTGKSKLIYLRLSLTGRPAVEFSLIKVTSTMNLKYGMYKVDNILMNYILDVGTDKNALDLCCNRPDNLDL